MSSSRNERRDAATEWARDYTAFLFGDVIPDLRKTMSSMPEAQVRVVLAVSSAGYSAFTPREEQEVVREKWPPDPNDRERIAMWARMADIQEGAVIFMLRNSMLEEAVKQYLLEQQSWPNIVLVGEPRELEHELVARYRGDTSSCDYHPYSFPSGLLIWVTVDRYPPEELSRFEAESDDDE